MDFCDEALAQFCQGLGVVVPTEFGPLIHLELERIGTLQLERHEHSLTLWLVLDPPAHALDEAVRCALTLVYSRCAPALPLRCGLASGGRLVLLITLQEQRVSVPLLQQAYQTLMAGRAAVLAE